MISHIRNFHNDMISIKTDNYKDNTITFFAHSDQPPMLEISSNGFLVNGKPVPIDEKQAETVYAAFHQWLTLAWLSNDDRR